MRSGRRALRRVPGRDAEPGLADLPPLTYLVAQVPLTSTSHEIWRISLQPSSAEVATVANVSSSIRRGLLVLGEDGRGREDLDEVVDDGVASALYRRPNVGRYVAYFLWFLRLVWPFCLVLRESQNIPGSPREVHSPRVLAATVVAEHFLEAEYDECTTASGTRTAIIRSSVLILLAVLMMRHAFSLVDEDNDLYNLSSVFLLRVLTFLMPVYIMAWIATVLLQR
ncbi:hypothetical protein U1Q18_038530, partial [Sarracenia purpurea var. burkii]